MKNYVSFSITIGVVPKWFKGPVCKTVIRRFESGRRLFFEKFIAWVVELVDTTDLKSVGSNTVPVRVRPRVHDEKPHTEWGFFVLHASCIINIVIAWIVYLFQRIVKYVLFTKKNIEFIWA